MERPERRLVVLRTSPWSERARWALDHHGLAYRTIQHTPFLGERRLRRLVGGGQKRATVPVLLAGEQILTETWDIACYADREGRGTTLIPLDREGEVRKWNALADDTMASARALLIPRLLASPKALEETLPPGIARWMRPLLRPVTRYGTEWFARKYELRFEDAPSHLGKLRAALEDLRAALSNGSPCLLGSFSYADVVMAVVLQAVSPVGDRYLPLEPASRKAWTLDEVAAEFPDLVAWRDGLYARHRK